MLSSDYVMPLLCFIVGNYEIYQSELEVQKLDTMYHSAEFTLCNKLLERLKIPTTSRKQFHLEIKWMRFWYTL